jgi:hypothetical protein
MLTVRREGRETVEGRKKLGRKRPRRHCPRAPSDFRAGALWRWRGGGREVRGLRGNDGDQLGSPLGAKRAAWATAEMIYM